MIDYYTTTLIHLSLEPYTNAGLTAEETKAIIEEIPDPGSSSLMLRCEHQGINDNWNVRTMAVSVVLIDWLVLHIEDRLKLGLARKFAKMPAAKTNT